MRRIKEINVNYMKSLKCLHYSIITIIQDKEKTDEGC